MGRGPWAWPQANGLHPVGSTKPYRRIAHGIGMRQRCDDLTISREALNLYGSLEPAIRAIRDHRPMDLNAERWRQANPDGSFEQWRRLARQCVLDGLHHDPGPVDLQAETLGRTERDGLIVETVGFNTAPWSRVEGYFLLPKGVDLPLPGLVVFHAWGGPMLFGAERIVNTGRDCRVLIEHRAKVYSGNYLAEEFARAGFAVIVIDAHHFGRRAPRGLNGIPEAFDPFELSDDEFERVSNLVVGQLYLGVRQLNWAGTTWMGVNFWDDSRCVDYLQSRPEVDSDNIGCAGLSGGGWRTDMLAALEPRIKAQAGAGWMTTGDYQQVYNVAGAVGSFCLLPGVWDRLDVPDLTIMSAPCASMVISGQQDQLFPPEAQADAAGQIAAGFEWAGCPEKFSHNNPPKPHCYDADLQADAIAWFRRALGRGATRH